MRGAYDLSAPGFFSFQRIQRYWDKYTSGEEELPRFKFRKEVAPVVLREDCLLRSTKSTCDQEQSQFFNCLPTEVRLCIFDDLYRSNHLLFLSNHKTVYMKAQGGWFSITCQRAYNETRNHRLRNLELRFVEENVYRLSKKPFNPLTRLPRLYLDNIAHVVCQIPHHDIFATLTRPEIETMPNLRTFTFTTDKCYGQLKFKVPHRDVLESKHGSKVLSSLVREKSPFQRRSFYQPEMLSSLRSAWWYKEFLELCIQKKVRVLELLHLDDIDGTANREYMVRVPSRCELGT